MNALSEENLKEIESRLELVNKSLAVSQQRYALFARDFPNRTALDQAITSLHADKAKLEIEAFALREFLES